MGGHAVRISRPLVLLALAVCLGACRSDGPGLRIERLPVSPAHPLAAPAGWLGAYGDAVAALASQAGAVMEAADPAATAVAVRQGRARFALTASGEAAGLAAQPFDAVPLALVVPLTFPVEELSAAQARDIAAGRLRDWKQAGGPAAPITLSLSRPDDDPGMVRRALGDDAAPRVEDVSARPGSAPLWLERWTGPTLGRKALRVDGRLPGDGGYPLVDRRVLAGREADGRVIEAMSSALRAELERRRPPEITLDAVGDIMLGRGVGALIGERGAAYPFAAVRPLLAAADLRFGNLELPLTERGVAADKDYVFRAPPGAVAALSAAGFTVLSLANNHALDYGPDGMLDTIAALDRAGIAHAGAGHTPEEAHRPALLAVKGVRLALLAYVNVPDDSITGFQARGTAAAAGRPGVAWGTAEAVRRDVAAAKGQADVVIVSLHSGFEYTASPNAVQRELAHAAVEAGAALVLGGHPHVLQGVEFYRGAPIIYSLGNFVFDLDDADRRQPGLPSVLTVIFRVTITPRGVTGVRFIPAIIDAREGRPLPVSGVEARPVLQRLYRLTEALAPITSP